MATTNFVPSKHGFHFPNNFVNKLIGGAITTRGRCGGMAFGSLDYYVNSVPVPTCDTADFGSSLGVPPDGTPLADYIMGRLDGSLLLYAASFIRWNGASDHATVLGGKGIVAATKQDEWPKLKASLDSGAPVALGLLTATTTGGVSACHQVVAYDYAVGQNSLTISIYDNNYPDDDTVTISSTIDATNPHWNESSHGGLVDVWRAFFVEDGSPTVDYAGLMLPAPAPGTVAPPVVDIVMTTSVSPSSSTPFDGQAFSCGFSVKNNGPYPAHAKYLYLLASGGPGSAQFTGILGADTTSPLDLQPGQSYSMLKQTANLNVPVGVYSVQAGYYNNPSNLDFQWIEIPTLPGVSRSAPVDVLQGLSYVHQLYYDNSKWSDQDLTSIANGALAEPGSGTCGFAISDGQHVYCVASDQHVHQLYYNNSKWSDQDLTSIANGASAQPGIRGISSLASGDGQHVYFKSLSH